MTTDPLSQARLEKLARAEKRGRDAADLLANPLLREALDHMQRELMGRMATVDLTDAALHTKLILSFQQLARFEAVLFDQIGNGEMAKSKLIEAGRFQKLRAAWQPSTRLSHR